MHKTPFISVSRKVSLDGMAMRSRSLPDQEAPPQHDYVAVMMSHCHSSLANLNEYGSEKVTPKSVNSVISRSPSPTFDDDHHHMDSVSSSPSTTRSSYRGGSSASLKKRDRQRQLDAGLTFKGHPRQFARHNYHDHANDDLGTSSVEQVSEIINVRGGVKTPFPLRLHNMLEAADKEGLTDIVSWQPHGRAFCVHNTQRFVDQIMPRFFQQHKYSSFQRQLNLYGFMRLTRKGPDHGGYYHELFLRGKVFLCASIQRIRVKGTLIRTTSSPETEPDFYLMPSVEAASMSSDANTTTTTTTTTATSIPDMMMMTMPTPALPPVFPSFSAPAVVEDSTLLEARRRLDQVLANTASGQRQQPPPQQQLTSMPSITDFSALFDHPMPRWEAGILDETDLAYFLDEVDFYSPDVELLAEI